MRGGAGGVGGDSETRKPRKGTKATKHETPLSCPSLSFAPFVFQTPLHHPNLLLRQSIQLIHRMVISDMESFLSEFSQCLMKSTRPYFSIDSQHNSIHQHALVPVLLLPSQRACQVELGVFPDRIWPWCRILPKSSRTGRREGS